MDTSFICDGQITLGVTNYVEYSFSAPCTIYVATPVLDTAITDVDFFHSPGVFFVTPIILSIDMAHITRDILSANWFGKKSWLNLILFRWFIQILSALPPSKDPLPTIGHELWGRAHVGYSENFEMTEHSKIYISVYKGICCVLYFHSVLSVHVGSSK